MARPAFWNSSREKRHRQVHRQRLCGFVVYLADDYQAYSTIRYYLSAVRQLQNLRVHAYLRLLSTSVRIRPPGGEATSRVSFKTPVASRNSGHLKRATPPLVAAVEAIGRHDVIGGLLYGVLWLLRAVSLPWTLQCFDPKTHLTPRGCSCSRDFDQNETMHFGYTKLAIRPDPFVAPFWAGAIAVQSLAVCPGRRHL